MTHPEIQKLIKIMTLCEIIDSPAELIGCRLQSIEHMMNDQAVDFLPPVYVDFMKVMGFYAGKLYFDYTYNCEVVGQLKRRGIDELSDLGKKASFPEGAFVFLTYIDYVYWYFHTSGKDEDPPVFAYFMMDGAPKLIAQSLTQFWAETIEELRPNTFKYYQERNWEK